MRHHSQYFAVAVVWKCANDFVLSRWQIIEVGLAYRQISHLKILIFVGTVVDALRDPLLEKVDARVEEIVLVKVLIELAIIEFGKESDLKVLRKHL